MIKRTANQADANDVDLELYRLFLRAERHADDTSRSDRERELWGLAASRLIMTRGNIRAMMKKSDRLETGG